MLHNGGQFAAAEHEIEGHEDQAAAGPGQQGFVGLVRIVEEQAQPVARLQPHCVQPAGEAIHPLQEVPVFQAGFSVHQRLFVREAFGGLQEHVADGHYGTSGGPL